MTRKVMEIANKLGGDDKLEPEVAERFPYTNQPGTSKHLHHWSRWPHVRITLLLEKQISHSFQDWSCWRSIILKPVIKALVI